MDNQKRASSPTRILLEPLIAERSGQGDAWPKHGRSKRGPSGGTGNLWIPSGRRVDSRQKEDAENTGHQRRAGHSPVQSSLGRRPDGSLRELVGNSTSDLRIQVISPKNLPANAAADEARRKDEIENKNELPVARPLIELARVGTPDQGPARGSASLFRPLSSTSRLLHTNSRPGSGHNGRTAKLVAGLWFLDSISRPSSRPNSRRVRDGQSLFDVGEHLDAEQNHLRKRTDGGSSDTDDVRHGDSSNSKRQTSVRGSPEANLEQRSLADADLEVEQLLRSRDAEGLGAEKRAGSAFSFYPTTLEEAPTSRWNIDSESDLLLFEELGRLAGQRPATSLGLQSPRNDLYLGKHSSEIWGSLSERARKLAQEKEDQKPQRKEVSRPPVDLGRLTPQLRARSAPVAMEWQQQKMPRGRNASLWTWHDPADRMLGKAQGRVAKRLRQEIAQYRENSFQREDLEARVETQKEAAQQLRRRSFAEFGSIPDRNRQNLEQHTAEQRNKQLEARARTHRERWAIIVERHVARQRKEEEARDELILLQLTQQEEDQAAADRERTQQFILERRRWWTTLIALGGRLQLLADTVKVQRDVRFWQELRNRAACRIQHWFRKTQAKLMARRRNAAAKRIQRFVRSVVLGRKSARKRRYAGLIGLFLRDMQRSQALMLAFRTFRQRVMTIQRVVGLRLLRVRAQVALVVRQWEVAEENWIKTHELAALRAQAPSRAPSRARSRPGSTGGSVDSARSRTGSGGSSSFDSASGAASYRSKRPSGRPSTINAEKALPKGGKVTSLTPGEIHRLLFNTRDGVLGPEYASSGIHVPREIQESVVKDFCMRKRNAHVKFLEQYKVQRAEDEKKQKEADAMQRTKRFLQGKTGDHEKKKQASQVPRLRVLATRKELQAMMLEGVAKAAVEAMSNTDSLAQGLSSGQSSGKTTPVVSRRGTREVHVMAAISEMDLAGHVPSVLSLIPKAVNLLAADGVELGQSRRRETRRGTARKVVTWDAEVAPAQ